MKIWVVLVAALLANSCRSPSPPPSEPEPPSQPNSQSNHRATQASEKASAEPSSANNLAQAADLGPPVDSGAPAAVAFPTFGVSFDLPQGWQQEDVVQPSGFIARWLKEGARDGGWSQFTVQITTVGDVTTHEAANRFTRSGYVAKQQTLGGLPAMRLTRPPGADGNAGATPEPIYVAVRGGLAFYVVFLLDQHTDPSEIDRILESWQWRDPEPVADHLELGPVRPILDGRASLRLPIVVRLDRSDPLSPQGYYVAYDYATGQDALLINMEATDVVAEEADRIILKERVRAYADTIRKHAALDEPLTFEVWPNKPNVFASQTIFGQFAQPGRPTVTRRSRFAVWQPTPELIINLQFVVNDEVVRSADAQNRMARSIEQILASLGGPVP